MNNNILKTAIALTTACFITIGLVNPLSDSYLLMEAYNVSAEEIEELAYTENNDIGLIYDNLIVSRPDGYFYVEYGNDDVVAMASSSQLYISTEGVNFITAREGFHSTCYMDGSQSSIGFGTKCGTTVHTSGLHSITLEKAKSDMLSQIDSRYSPVVRRQTTGIDMNQNQFDALVSLAYNTGGGTNIISASPLVRYLKGELSESNARRLYSQYYIKSSGKVLQGLINRRNAEADLFFKNCQVHTEIIITNASEPNTTMNIGDNFTVSGQIASGIPLTYIEVGCYDLNDRLITGSGTDADGSRNYNIRNLDNQVNFNALSSGVYKYKVVASNSNRTETLVEKNFIILSNDMTIEDGTYTICSAQNTTYQMTAAGSNTQLNRDNDLPEQAWLIAYWRDGYYTIRNYYSGLYLDVYNAGSTEGTNVWQHEKNDSAAQHWQIVPAGGDTYCIIPQCAGERCLDAVGGSAGDGVNLALYAPHLGANQRFVFTHTNCSFTSGTKITFNANGGTLPTAYTSYTANGVNKGRGVGELIVYNVPNMLVNTNEYGNEAMVNYSGLVTDYRKYGNTSHLYVPWGGFVISGHLNGGTDGSSFVDKIRTGYYVGFDYSTKRVSVYTSVDGYLANHKYVNSGSTYGSLPVPTRSGYNFDGWYTSASGGTKVTSSSTYSASRLYAHWSSADEKVVKISSTTFPDPIFRAYVSSSSVDSDEDGYLSESELKFRKTMNLSNRNISSLEGIEYFTSLGWLTCQGNNLTDLDLSHNKELEVLNCSDNKLTAIDISNNKKLSQFLCSGNNLTSLDVSNNPNISIEHFYGANQDKYNIGTIIDSYYLSNLTKYGFVPSKASNWKGATYNSATNTLTDFTSLTVSYDYDCGNGFTVTFYLIADSIPKYIFVDVNSTNFPDSVFRAIPNDLQK